MRKLSGKITKRLFSGPLSSFAAKIDLVYALNLIEHETHDDLRVLLTIRNTFAHTMDFLDFSSPSIAKEFSKFKGWRPDRDPKAFFDEVLVRTVDRVKEVRGVLLHASTSSEKPND